MNHDEDEDDILPPTREPRDELDEGDHFEVPFDAPMPVADSEDEPLEFGRPSRSREEGEPAGDRPRRRRRRRRRSGERALEGDLSERPEVRSRDADEDEPLPRTELPERSERAERSDRSRGSRERSERSDRGERSRERPRPVRPREDVEAEIDADYDAPENDLPLPDDDLEAGEEGHGGKRVPTWEETVGILVEANIASRANSPEPRRQGGRRPRRDRDGRDRDGRGRDSR